MKKKIRKQIRISLSEEHKYVLDSLCRVKSMTLSQGIEHCIDVCTRRDVNETTDELLIRSLRRLESSDRHLRKLVHIEHEVLLAIAKFIFIHTDDFETDAEREHARLIGTRRFKAMLRVVEEAISGEGQPLPEWSPYKVASNEDFHD